MPIGLAVNHNHNPKPTVKILTPKLKKKPQKQRNFDLKFIIWSKSIYAIGNFTLFRVELKDKIQHYSDLLLALPTNVQLK